MKADLARQGRDTGQIYLVDPDGALGFVTPALEEAKDAGAYRTRALVPEIWVRTPGSESYPCRAFRDSGSRRIAAAKFPDRV